MIPFKIHMWTHDKKKDTNETLQCRHKNVSPTVSAFLRLTNNTISY